MDRPNPVTPADYAALRTEYEQLFAIERPAPLARALPDGEHKHEVVAIR